ncbi:YfhO family protein [Kitasatospora sp. NBC_01250]|uniref:YfhO family protein n=1 Tax=Kitasatospora sp. NBC_01250 TaxID=2903571 RepID=UPI002E377C93|nr:YfhO family protein [Kitasatospora sp. NBC_01250]
MLAVGVYVVALAARRGYPFGAGPRAGTVLAEQVVPLHAHLWDLLHGRGGGDLLVNWNSGYGVPFLPDLVTDLLNPFSLLVLLVPREQVALAVFLGTLLSIGLGTALMTVFLGRLAPGPGWLRALLATGYGLCAWVLVEGVGRPAWLWGLVSLPLVGLAFDRCLRRTGWPLGAVAVALAWVGNFYTAAAATLGAALVLVLRLLVDRRPAGERLRSLGRALAMTATGVAAAAPVLWVTFEAGRTAVPAAVPHPGTPGLTDYLARLLPGTPAGSGLPEVFTGVPVLLLVAALPFNRAVPVRERLVWPLALALVAIAFVWRPSQLLWHVATAPQGDPYRSTFVLAGLLTMAAWVGLAHRPGPLALGCGAALLAGPAALAGARGSTPLTWVLLGAGVPVLVGALWALASTGAGRRRAAATVLGCAVLLGSGAAAYAALGPRDREPDDPTAATTAALPVPVQAVLPAPEPAAEQAAAARRLLRSAEDWPAARADPGPTALTGNDPMLLGGQGGGYRSDYLPLATAQALHSLGAGWLLQGRQTLSAADPVGQALLAVGSSLQPGPTVRRSPAAPLVTVRPPGAPTPPSGAPVWARQQALLGAAVYQVPVLVPGAGPAPTDHGRSGWSLPTTPAGEAGTELTAGCAPGRLAYLYAPYLNGRLSWPGGVLTVRGEQNATALPILPLGPVPADGVVRVTVHVELATQVPASPFGCLDPAALAQAVQGLRAGGARSVRAGGHTVSAELPPGSTGSAVLAVPAVPGWRCGVDGGPSAPAGSVQGLLAVPLGPGASRIGCTFEQPGLAPGLWVSAAAVGGWLLVTVGSWWRRRERAAAPPGPAGLNPPAGRAAGPDVRRC